MSDSNVENDGFTKAETILLPFLKNHGKKGIIVFVVVLIICVMIVVFSKIEESQSSSMPIMWKGRIRSIVNNAAKNIEISKQTDDPYIRYHHALIAESMMKSVKDLIGGEDISKVTGIEVSTLEEEINKYLDTKNIEMSQKGNTSGEFYKNKKVLKTRFAK